MFMLLFNGSLVTTVLYLVAAVNELHYNYCNVVLALMHFFDHLNRLILFSTAEVDEEEEEEDEDEDAPPRKEEDDDDEEGEEEEEEDLSGEVRL